VFASPSTYGSGSPKPDAGPVSGLTKPILIVWSACETRGAAHAGDTAAPETARPPAPIPARLSSSRLEMPLPSAIVPPGVLRSTIPDSSARTLRRPDFDCQHGVPTVRTRAHDRGQRPVAVARARSCDPVCVHLDTTADRGQRDRTRRRAQPLE